MKNEKVLIPTIVAIVFLIVMVVGATYAYFTVGTSGSANTTLTASTPSIGTVALASGSAVKLTLTANQMMKKSANTSYWATTSGTANTTATNITIATATVTGSGTYNCTATLKITPTDIGLYTAFQGMTGKTADQIVLTVNGTTYDFNTASLFTASSAKTQTVTLNSLTSAAAKNITASLKFVNLVSVDQSALAGKSFAAKFEVSGLSCTAA